MSGAAKLRLARPSVALSPPSPTATLANSRLRPAIKAAASGRKHQGGRGGSEGARREKVDERLVRKEEGGQRPLERRLRIHAERERDSSWLFLAFGAMIIKSNIKIKLRRLLQILD